MDKEITFRAVAKSLCRQLLSVGKSPVEKTYHFHTAVDYFYHFDLEPETTYTDTVGEEWLTEEEFAAYKPLYLASYALHRKVYTDIVDDQEMMTFEGWDEVQRLAQIFVNSR